MDSFEMMAVDIMKSRKYNSKFINPNDRVDFFSRVGHVLTSKDGVVNFRVAQLDTSNMKGYKSIKSKRTPLKKFDSMVKCSSGNTYYFGFDYKGDK